MQPPRHDLAALGRIYQLESNPEWETLIRTAEFADEFTFSVLLVPDSAGAELCRERLRERLRDLGRGELEDCSPQSTGDWPEILQRLVHGRTKPGTAVVWVAAAVGERDPEYGDWRESWRYAATQINQFRNLLETGVGCFLIFVGCDWLKLVLRDCAPDLWSIRTGVVEIRPPVSESVGVVPVERPLETGASDDAPDPEMALRQVEALRGRPGQELALARALARAGSGLNARFEYLKAIPLWREALGLRHDFGGSKLEILQSMQGLWDPLYRTGNLDEAFLWAREIAAKAHEIDNSYLIADAYRRLAWLLKDRGDLALALEYHQQTESIYRSLGETRGLAGSLASQAGILQVWGKLDQSMNLLKEAEVTFRVLGDSDGLQATLGNQAWILKTKGKMEEALNLHKEQEEICRSLGNKIGLSKSLGGQGLVLRAMGRLPEAFEKHKQEEAICREISNKAGLQQSLGHQGLIRMAEGDIEQSIWLLKQQEQLCQELGDKDGLSVSLGNQALIRSHLGQTDLALELRKREEALCRELGDRAGLAMCLANQAQIQRRLMPPDLVEARRLLTEAVRIVTEIGMPKEREQFQRALDEIPPPAK